MVLNPQKMAQSGQKKPQKNSPKKLNTTPELCENLKVDQKKTQKIDFFKAHGPELLCILSLVIRIICRSVKNVSKTVKNMLFHSTLIGSHQSRFLSHPNLKKLPKLTKSRVDKYIKSKTVDIPKKSKLVLTRPKVISTSPWVLGSSCLNELQWHL